MANKKVTEDDFQILVSELIYSYKYSHRGILSYTFALVHLHRKYYLYTATFEQSHRTFVISSSRQDSTLLRIQGFHLFFFTTINDQGFEHTLIHSTTSYPTNPKSQQSSLFSLSRGVSPRLSRSTTPGNFTTQGQEYRP